MYRMALLLFAIPEEYFKSQNISFDTCVKMCILHDLAEAKVGDITPTTRMPKSDKHTLECKAIDELEDILKMIHRGASELGLKTTDLKEMDQSRNVKYIWDAYEEQDTKESILVKDLDRFEMILQAYQYETGKY